MSTYDERHGSKTTLSGLCFCSLMGLLVFVRTHALLLCHYVLHGFDYWMEVQVKKQKKNKETKKEKSLSYGYKSFPMICYSLLKQFSTFYMPKKDRLQKVLCRVDLSLWSKGELRKWLLVRILYIFLSLNLVTWAHKFDFFWCYNYDLDVCCCCYIFFFFLRILLWLSLNCYSLSSHFKILLCKFFLMRRKCIF